MTRLADVADAQDKAAFRRWARENHPDVGGDPGVFSDGVRALEEGRWTQFAAGPVEPAPDAPPSRATVYVHRSARGLAKVIVTAQRWNARRKQPPRVR